MADIYDTTSSVPSYEALRLTDQEWQQFSELVQRFTTAKRAKDYAESDRIRRELLLWQRQTPDEEFISMADRAHYTFHPWFEDWQHAQARVRLRLN